jgi:histidine triad (HIT) family protein
MPPYDPNNIFAKILRGEIPCHKLYEDKDNFAFLDIMPRGPGHSLVIPKAPVRNILDAGDEVLMRLMPVVARIARAAKSAFGAAGTTIHQFSEPAGGQVVFHLHVHVIPRFEGVALLPPASQMEKPEVLAGNAEKIRKALSSL